MYETIYHTMPIWPASLVTFFNNLMKQRSMRPVVSLLKAQSTVLFLSLATVAISAIFATTSIFQLRPAICTTVPSIDDNFYSSLSQTTLGAFSAFLILLPPLRARNLHLRYPIWFRLSLSISVISGLASTAIYPFSWQASVLCNYVANLAQVIATLQLVECVNTAATSGEIGG